MRLNRYAALAAHWRTPGAVNDVLTDRVVVARVAADRAWA